MISRHRLSALPLMLLLTLCAPRSGYSGLSSELENTDPRTWSYQLDPGLGLKGGVFFVPSSTGENGSDVTAVGGPLASLRFLVYDGAGTLFTQVDLQMSMLLNTPVTAAFLPGAGLSVGYRFRKQEINLWLGLSYEGFLNYNGAGGAVARVGISKAITDTVNLEAELSYFYANQTVPAGTLNYELPALDVLLSFPIDIGPPHQDMIR